MSDQIRKILESEWRVRQRLAALPIADHGNCWSSFGIAVWRLPPAALKNHCLVGFEDRFRSEQPI
jgi:hypothetical protein